MCLLVERGRCPATGFGAEVTVVLEETEAVVVVPLKIIGSPDDSIGCERIFAGEIRSTNKSFLLKVIQGSLQITAETAHSVGLVAVLAVADNFLVADLDSLELSLSRG